MLINILDIEFSIGKSTSYSKLSFEPLSMVKSKPKVYSGISSYLFFDLNIFLHTNSQFSYR